MKRLNTPLDVGFINRTFFPDVDPNDVKRINTGRCYLWAYIAFHMYEGVQLWSMGAHAFVYYRGKFYDSERPDGVEDWKLLPATNGGRGCGCRNCLQPAERYTVNRFKSFKHWGAAVSRSTSSRNAHWERVRSQVQRAIETHSQIDS